MDKLLHKGEHIGVVGGGGQDQTVIAEGIRHSLGHIVPGQIVDDHRAVQSLQLLFQPQRGLPGVAVDRGVGDDNPFAFGAVGGPDVIEVDIITKVFLQHRAVEGTDDGNVQSRGLFQQGLDLGAVFAHDADVVAAGFVGPLLLLVQGTELAEAVSGEQDLIGAVKAHQHLGPVDHGGGDEGQGMAAQIQGIALAHHHPAV